MQEDEITTAVEKFITLNTLDAKVVEAEFIGGDEYCTVRVEVAREDFERALTLDSWGKGYSIRWQQRTPILVGAEVGDLVLIYNDSRAQNEDVGLVSSKFTEENGAVYYGCRYIKLGLNNQFVNSLYDFQLTQENYGGFPKGFLKVLTAQETIEYLRAALLYAYEQKQKAVQAKFERSGKKLEDLVSFLGTAKKLKCDKIDLGYSYHLAVEGV